MQWLIAILTYNGLYANLLIQTEDDRLYKAIVDNPTPENIRATIAEQFDIPIERVAYHDTKQTLYRRLTYMRFVVME